MWEGAGVRNVTKELVVERLVVFGFVLPPNDDDGQGHGRVRQTPNGCIQNCKLQILAADCTSEINSCNVF